MVHPYGEKPHMRLIRRFAFNRHCHFSAGAFSVLVNNQENPVYTLWNQSGDYIVALGIDGLLSQGGKRDEFERNKCRG